MSLLFLLVMMERIPSMRRYGERIQKEDFWQKQEAATKPSVFARGFSHITTIPATSGGTTSPSFSWTSDSWMWTAEGLKIKKGSDNVIAAISLNPNIG